LALFTKRVIYVTQFYIKENNNGASSAKNQIDSREEKDPGSRSRQ
jgi:hypothetical protein